MSKATNYTSHNYHKEL